MCCVQILTRLREIVCCITRSNFLRFHLLVFPSADRLPAGRFGFVRATTGRYERRNAANRISRFPFEAARSVFNQRAGPASESLSIRQTIRAGSGRSGTGLGTDVGPKRPGSANHYAEHAVLLVSLGATTTDWSGRNRFSQHECPHHPFVVRYCRAM